MSFVPAWDPRAPVAQQRREAMLARIAEVRALEQRAEHKSAEARPSFERRGQLLPRERVGLLLDPGASWLPLCSLAGYRQDEDDADRSVPGAGLIAGIGFIRGVRCLVVASDSGIEAGAIQPMGLQKLLRVQEIALANRLPFVHLVESAGANLLRYRVEDFVHGGGVFRNLARLSGAGIPVITVQHGSGTAGGAYFPGLSDVVIMVRGRSRAFLAGPPLLLAATGEVANEEELGGAEMHTSVSGLGEYLAEDDRQALGIARDVVGQLALTPAFSREREREQVRDPASFPLPLPPAGEGWGEGAREDLLTLIPTTLRDPVDTREIMVRLVDDASLLEFKSLYGAGTVCAQGRIAGHPVGWIGNNGPIDVAGASKAAHFIQWMCQLGHAIVYLQNTTGYMVGRDSEQAGMITHGSRMIQAVTHATVPQLTIQCGASFGAGNYGMCGRAYGPRFLFSWPCARTAVMGGEQAARTMQIVSEAAAARKGIAADAVQSRAQYERIVDLFESQADALHTSGLLLDDGVIDPRDTRAVLAFCLDTIVEGQAKQPRPIQFGVART